MNEQRRLIVIGAVLVFALLFVFAYALPRQRQLARLEQEIVQMQKVQADLDKILPQVAEESGPALPAPKPSVTAWISANALRGLDRRVVSNNPYKGTQGGELKLRSLKAEEVTALLHTLTQVNLVVRHFHLTDLGGRGVWDMDLMVEVPEGAQ